ncbi:hypothetical protein AB0C80_18715 [Streptomyces anthocyanicus]|uniref:type II toxin-antitoxin system Phd/YefM family antitoxin n=1 Tax=Streptomyces anthocyanicus TaxID=68174 RepID=UPI0033DE0582
MTEYNAKDMRSKAGQMLDEARRGEEVVIWRRGAERFVLRYEAEGAHSGEHQVDISMSTGADDLLGQLIDGQSTTNDLLRQLVEHKDTVLDDLIKQTKAHAAEVVTSGAVTARVDEEPQRPVVVIPERVEDSKPEPPSEPSPEELRAAREYFGLREVPQGLEITEKGIQSALGTVKKIARQDPDSAEAKVMDMGPADEDRIEFLRCVQLDKLSKALAKRAAGDRRWLGSATPF